MVRFPIGQRMECLNEIRPGKICGAHLPPGQTFCHVCGEKAMTRRVGARYEIAAVPRVRRDWIARP